MGSLGSHPHIVTTFDLGDHEGQPYMVRELMAAALSRESSRMLLTTI